jgi:hypothetical protein
MHIVYCIISVNVSPKCILTISSSPVLPYYSSISLKEPPAPTPPPPAIFLNPIYYTTSPLQHSTQRVTGAAAPSSPGPFVAPLTSSLGLTRRAGPPPSPVLFTPRTAGFFAVALPSALSAAAAARASVDVGVVILAPKVTVSSRALFAGLGVLLTADPNPGFGVPADAFAAAPAAHTNVIYQLTLGTY